VQDADGEGYIAQSADMPLEESAKAKVELLRIGLRRSCAELIDVSVGIDKTSILLSLLMVWEGSILDHGHALDAREGDDVGHPLLQSIPYLLKIDLLRTETHLRQPNRKKDQNQPYC
jgi:hypothetical protein